MEISVSILDAIDRIDSIRKLNVTNVNYIHVDVMDGKFVPKKFLDNIEEVKDINKVSYYGLDIHLMVDNPIEFIDKYKDMSVEYITFHLEINKNIGQLISRVKSFGYKVGLSIKPDTNIEEIVPYLKDIDLVLVMSVEPGLGGQKFLDSTIDRVNYLKNIIVNNHYNVKIEVDGGINIETISKLDNVDIAVVGSYITKSDDYDARIEELLSAKKDLIN